MREMTMKKLIRMATPLMAVALMSGAPLFAHAQNNQEQTSQVQDWNTPPAGTEQAQQGYRDGIEAAKLDKAANRKIDAKSSHLYVHPPVKGAARDEYRASFTAGYDAAVKHSGM
jgi:outer membrane murein-binding lipoprotein Lpp